MLMKVCTCLHFRIVDLNVILMGCLPTKHVGYSPRSLSAHEAVSIAAESSCEKVDLPDFLNIAKGTPCENFNSIVP